ncbi:MAG: hypothetical protein LBR48_02290, partial [Dysgonamonadaceae bacterium]|nr:hypothetical protein [Dysgonamonadaceae bacterium]
MIIDRIHKTLLSNNFILFLFIAAFATLRFSGGGTGVEVWSATALQITIAVALLVVNNVFNIIRTKTFLPAIFFLLLSSGIPAFCDEWRGSIATVCATASYVFLFASYQRERSEALALNIGLLLTVGSLLVPPLLLTLPIFWFGFSRLQSWNWRVIPASLMGFAAVYILLFAWSVYRDDNTVFAALLASHSEVLRFSHPDFSLIQWSTNGLVLILFVVAGVKIYVSDISENIATVVR